MDNLKPRKLTEHEHYIATYALSGRVPDFEGEVAYINCFYPPHTFDYMAPIAEDIPEFKASTYEIKFVAVRSENGLLAWYPVEDDD